MRERIPLHPAASNCREHWRQVARPRDRVVFDAADTGDVLGDDAECPSFLLRSDGPPKMHHTVRDDDIRFGRVRPFLRAQLRERLLAELRRQEWANSAEGNVVVSEGVVHFWGTVGSEEERRALRVVAENIPGVRGIEDHTITGPRYLAPMFPAV